MSAPSPKRFRVVVIEWLSHDAIIEAPNAEAAEAEERRCLLTYAVGGGAWAARIQLLSPIRRIGPSHVISANWAAAPREIAARRARGPSPADGHRSCRQ